MTRNGTVTAALVILTIASPPATVESQSSVPAIHTVAEAHSTDEADLRIFQEAVDQYVNLHRRLRKELPPLVPGLTGTEINARSDSLAMAIQRARPRARQGDFFSAGATRIIKDRVLDLLRQNSAVLVGIDDEPSNGPALRVNLRFPGAGHLATMPPSLLQVLPPLPPELEYRIVGNLLVLRDIDASLILDYITDAVPGR